MPIPITIPRLGWNMEEGVFAGWIKRDGEVVREGEPLFSLEGDKATQDVESIDPGILRIPATAPVTGAKVLVGAVIGYLLQPGEAEPVVASASASASAPAPSPAPAPASATASKAVPEPVGRPARNGPRSTPLARRIAREMGVDWTRLLGSGHTGRIRKADVLEAARTATATAIPKAKPPLPDRPPAPAPTPAPAPGKSLPVGPARRTIAARMVQSRQATAPVTLTTTVDATNLVNLRKQFKDAGPAGRDVPSFNDFLVKLTAMALRDHPLLHARWADDRIEVPNEANIGIAVDTEGGLLVPVIHGAAALGLGQIAARSRELIGRAREGKLRPADMQGGTFTITNLGASGIDAFTPIINPPECAILGLGRIRRMPVMVGEQVVGRDQLTLSLTFDHRIVDGAPAARFLQFLGQLIENPGPWLIG